MADYNWTPMLQSTPYGDIAVNDPIAVAQLRAKAQAELAAQRMTDAQDLYAQQTIVEKQRNDAAQAVAQDALDIAQKRYDEIQAAQQAQAQAAQQAQQNQQVPQAQGSFNAQWQQFKQSAGYNSANPQDKATMIEQAADSMQKMHGWDNTRRDKVADAIRKQEAVAGTIQEDYVGPIDTVYNAGVKVLSGIAKAAPAIKGVLDGMSGSNWELDNQARMLIDTETSPYYGQDLETVKAALRPEFEAKAAKAMMENKKAYDAVDKFRSAGLTDAQLASDASRQYRSGRGFWSGAYQAVTNPIDTLADTGEYLAPALLTGPIVGTAILGASGYTESQQRNFEAAFDAAKKNGANDEGAMVAGLRQAHIDEAQAQSLLAAGLNAAEMLGPVGAKSISILRDATGKMFGKAVVDAAEKEAVDVVQQTAKATMRQRVADAASALNDRGLSGSLLDGAKKVASMSTVKGAGSEMLQEFSQSAQEKYDQNLAEVMAGARSQDSLMDGVWQAGRAGAGAAMVLGGAFGKLEGIAESTNKKATEAAALDGEDTTPLDGTAPTDMANDVSGFTPDEAPYTKTHEATNNKSFTRAPERVDGDTFASYYNKTQAEIDASVALAQGNDKSPIAGVDSKVLMVKAEELEKLRVKLASAAQKAATDSMGADRTKLTAGYIAGALYDKGDVSTADAIVKQVIGNFPTVPTIDAARIAINTNPKAFQSATFTADFKAAMDDTLSRLDANTRAKYEALTQPSNPINSAPQPEQAAPAPQTPATQGASAKAGNDTELMASVLHKLKTTKEALTPTEQVYAADNKSTLDAYLGDYRWGNEVSDAEYTAFKETGAIPQIIIDRVQKEGLQEFETSSSPRAVELAKEVQRRKDFIDAVAQGKPVESVRAAEPASDTKLNEPITMPVEGFDAYSIDMNAGFDAVNTGDMDFEIGSTASDDKNQVSQAARALAIANAAQDKPALKRIIQDWYDTKKTTTPALKQLINHIIDKLPHDLEVRVGNFVGNDLGKTFVSVKEGAYVEGTNVITLAENVQQPERVFMHEAMHVVTADAIEKARTSGGDSRASYDALMRILSDAKVREVLNKVVPVDFAFDPITYAKEAITVLTDTRYNHIRTALSKINVEVRQLQRTNAMKAIWAKIAKLIGWDGKAGTTDALSALYAHTFNLVSKPTMREGGNTLFAAYSPGAMDLIKFSRPDSKAMHDGVVWQDPANGEWTAEWVDANGAERTEKFDNSADAVAYMADSGLHPTARGRNTRLSEEAAVPTPEMRLSMMGKIASHVRRAIETLKGNGFDSQDTLRLATEAGIYWSHYLSTAFVDDLKLMDAMDATGALANDIKTNRRATTSDLERQGYGRMSTNASIERFKERLHVAGIGVDAAGKFAYAMAVPGYLKAVAANNGNDPYTLRVTQYRGSGFNFTDKNGVKHQAMFKPGMTMDEKIAAEMEVVDLYKAQFTKEELDTMTGIMMPLWKANRAILDMMVAVGGITARQYDAYIKNPYYAPLKDHEAHSLMKVESAIGRFTEADNPAIMLAAQIQSMRLRVGKLSELQLIGDFLSKHPTQHFELAVERFDVKGGEVTWERPFYSDGVIRIPYANGTMLVVKPKSKAAIKFFKSGQSNAVLRAAATLNRWQALQATTGSIKFQLAALVWDMFMMLANPQGALGKDASGNWILQTKDVPRFIARMAYYGAKNLPELFKTSATGTTANPLVRLFHATGGSINPTVAADFNSVRRDITAKTLLSPAQAAEALRDNKVAGSIAVANAAVGKARSIGGRALNTVHTTGEFFRFAVFAATMEHMTQTDLSNATKADLDAAMAKNPNAAKVAAQAANDLTTDFSRKSADPTMRSLFMFFQAAMTATFRTLPQVMSSPWGRGVMTAFVMMSIIARMKQCDDMGTDVDGTPKCLRAKKPDALLYMTDEYGSPVPPEFRPAKAIGDNFADVLSGRIGVMDAFLGSDACPNCGILHSVIGAVLPIRYTHSEWDAAGLAYAFAPTALGKVFVQHATGKDAFGNPIAAENVYDEKGRKKANPMNWERGRPGDTQMSKDVARAVALATGGSIDEVPYTYDAIFKEMMGSYISLFKDIGAGKDPMATFMPGFSGGYDSYAAKNQYEAEKKDLGKKISLLEAAQKEGKQIDVLKLQQYTAAQKRIANMEKRNRDQRVNGMTSGEIYRLREDAKQRGDSEKVAYYNEILDSIRPTSSQRMSGMIDSILGDSWND